MKESSKAIIGAIGLIAVLGFGITVRKCGPAVSAQQLLTKPAAEVSTKTKQKQVVKTTRKLPGGETTITTVTTEQSSTVRPIPSRDNRVQIGVLYPNLLPSGKMTNPVYEAGYERRLFKLPVFVGGKITSEKAIGLTTSVEF